ncbi:hypothetical protein SAMN05444365_101938 [Micromonospora pattaloongensis]|uniref:Tryptophan-associated transmembrane protein (Trp_oprn_chp) n=1 Tax=Micromonospora pattaloongensis TaxID=405436 RepID=A0A1H3HS47_9ACTN|nr:hypothetical protein [Micromonospora pattaloongensis]SDY17509.1 hypothetical protein SAMN05444365_101938 [Micromonospora pattaloongensis]
MGRKAALTLGSLLGTIGFVLALMALAVPWARYEVHAGDDSVAAAVAVFQVDRGWWYVTLLFVLIGCLAGAAAASGRAARIAAVAGIGVGVGAMLVASALGDQLTGSAVAPLPTGLAEVDFRPESAPGSTYGVAAPALLALGAALLSVRTPAQLRR